MKSALNGVKKLVHARCENNSGSRTPRGNNAGGGESFRPRILTHSTFDSQSYKLGSAIMEMILLIGLQATGKSTYYREKFFRTHVRVNLDMLRTRQRERLLVDACITGKTKFVVD